MTTYKVTTLFAAEWPELFASIFPDSSGCSASTVEGAIGVFSFDQPQTVANLGPLVKIEIAETPESHLPQ